jgi:hypothetical protein
MTNKTTPPATGGDLAELWRERVAALVEVTTIALTRSTISSGWHGRPTPPGSRFRSVSCFSKWMWKTHRMIARW